MMLTEGVALTFWLISAFSGRDLDFLIRSKEQQGKKMLKVGAHECVCVCVRLGAPQSNLNDLAEK